MSIIRFGMFFFVKSQLSWKTSTSVHKFLKLVTCKVFKLRLAVKFIEVSNCAKISDYNRFAFERRMISVLSLVFWDRQTDRRKHAAYKVNKLVQFLFPRPRCLERSKNSSSKNFWADFDKLLSVWKKRYKKTFW